MTKRLTLLTLLIAASVTVAAQTDKPVHLFILSGQSNMQGMNPETGFMPEAKQLFKDEEFVYIKVAKGGQPICRWLEEWLDIAKENGLDENHRRRIHRDGKVEFYQPILDQYQEMLKKHPKLTSVTFCWMQGERDAKERQGEVYGKSLAGLVKQLSDDLGRDDMNFVIGRLSDCMNKNPGKSHWMEVRKAQVEVAEKNPRGAWVDTDDLNGPKDGLHYNKEGYAELGKRFAEKAVELVKKGK